MEQKSERTATWNKRQQTIAMWVSPNCYGEREAKSEADARRRIDDSGVAQDLIVE